MTRTAIVTGAARGIGAGVAERLARDGFAVAVLDLDEVACTAVVDRIQAEGGELGEPTVLVNVAGGPKA
jgi:3-oxoacyl-[acyl-carrier protein] reductase